MTAEYEFNLTFRGTTEELVSMLKISKRFVTAASLLPLLMGNDSPFAKGKQEITQLKLVCRYFSKGA